MRWLVYAFVISAVACRSPMSTEELPVAQVLQEPDAAHESPTEPEAPPPVEEQPSTPRAIDAVEDALPAGWAKEPQSGLGPFEHTLWRQTGAPKGGVEVDVTKSRHAGVYDITLSVEVKTS